MKPGFCLNFLSLLIASGLISTVVAQTSNATTCPASLQPLPSDPNVQSSTSSILIASPSDATQEFVCFAGQSGYDSTGISCHALNCPASGYGYGYGQQGPYGNPYGGPSNRPHHGRGAISVGPLVAHVETAYACWKLKQIRLNTYVYLACFVKGYATMMYQVAFKEQGGLELSSHEAIPYMHLTSVGRGTFTAENSYQCIAAVYSSYADGCCKKQEHITNPANTLAPIYTICPNSYKWYFCGNVNIRDTIDVTVFYAMMTLHAVFVQVRPQQICVPTTTKSPPIPGFNCTKYELTPLLEYTIAPDIEKYVCTSRLEAEIVAIGIPPNGTAVTSDLYTLCGIRKSIMVSTTNATLLCAAVYADTVEGTCPPPGGQPTSQVYSSFCLLYDPLTNSILSTKVVFLAGSVASTDMFYLKGTVDCCQYVVTVGPGQQLLAYSVSAIITSLQTQTAPATIVDASINPLGLFNDAVTCSMSNSRCCGGSTTCITCTRPTRFGDKHLAELNCGSVAPAASPAGAYPGLVNYDESGNPVRYNNSAYGLQAMARGPYGQGPVLYAGVGATRPLNYSTPMLGPYGPGGLAPQMQYGMPQGPYQGPPMQPPQQQPMYGVRYGA